MNDELFNIVREDLKKSNREQRGVKCSEILEEKRLVEARLEKLFPGHDLEVVEQHSKGGPYYFRWYQPDLGINLAVSRIVQGDEPRADIVGEANGASRTVKIERAADVYSCKGFPSIYEYENRDEARDS